MKYTIIFLQYPYAFSVEERIRCCTGIDVDLDSSDLDPDKVIEI